MSKKEHMTKATLTNGKIELSVPDGDLCLEAGQTDLSRLLSFSETDIAQMVLEDEEPEWLFKTKSSRSVSEHELVD